jgi:hypothetical protein
VDAREAHFGDNIYNNIYNTAQKDGVRSLEKGSKALWNGDYEVANKELRTAVEEIDQEEQTREAAKAHYLLALAVLGKGAPRDKGLADLNELLPLLDS